MEEMDKKDKEIKIKCVSCGASLSIDEKKCSYCGSINPNYKPKEIKEIKPAKQVIRHAGVFGELFGNLFNDILDNFDED